MGFSGEQFGLMDSVGLTNTNPYPRGIRYVIPIDYAEYR